MSGSTTGRVQYFDPARRRATWGGFQLFPIFRTKMESLGISLKEETHFKSEHARSLTVIRKIL